MAKLLALVLAVVLLTPSSAFAYLDPATGSYVLQVLAGVFLGAVYLAKVYWLRIRMFFGGLRKLPDHADTP
jgi:hypothetical protein